MVSPVRIRVPPLLKVLQNPEISEESEFVPGAPLLQPYCNRVLAEGFVHRPSRGVTHPRENVRVSVEGDADV